ncbi:MAG: hypothetical protein NTU47_00010 [Ignavibacteriales bacterium]|nr:hypothetical protein [Ignavibacteriales bacterium]
MIEEYLNDLESRIDSRSEDSLLSEWKAFCDGASDADIFIPQRDRKIPPTIDWPDISINAAFENYELMALHQLKLCSDAIANGTGQLLNVRCNYGTGILPSLFEAEMFMMDDALNTLPTTRPMRGGEADLRSLPDKGIPNLHNGLGARVFEMADWYHSWMNSYPKIRRYVSIYHPDLQGPMDVCELLYGSDLVTALIEQPVFIHQLLDFITQTYIAFLNEWNKLVPPGDGYATHWSMMHKGQIMLRDDSAMNLSPEMFEEFIRPYDQLLLTTFGGGAIHFCGKGDHFIPMLSGMEKIYAIHMAQPEHNDPEVIFRNTVDKNIRILGLKLDIVRQARERGRDLKRSVHCTEGGRVILDAYKS